MKIIALEEGFVTEKVTGSLTDTDVVKMTIDASAELIGTDVIKAYLDLGEGRIAAMDEAGITMQVLSYSGPHISDAEEALRRATEANNLAAEAVKRHPERFAAFATLPLGDPKAAVAEFERTVTRLGFVGALISGTVSGEFLDDRKYWPVFECAQALNVPIYLHPGFPLPSLMETYFKGHEELAAPVWGFMVDASCHFLRILAAGVFDHFPGLRIILGHLGESIPYNLERIDNRLSLFARQRKLKKSPAEYIREHMLVTTSGNFSPQSVLCAIGTIGVDNVLFSVDWPNESNRAGVDFLTHLPVSRPDLEKIAWKNARRVLGLK
ncbi:MAG: amidohydrolase family protein [Candidatus Eremiobacteraeota bacterium]|nr:amidohydrolase family protein [Candidatus Eremiobacteraeota bacterium]